MVFNADADTAVYLNADPDPAFYLNADLKTDPGSQTNADPGGSGSWSDFYVTKSLIFTCKIYLLKVGNTVGKKITNEGKNAFLKGRISGLFLNFCQCSESNERESRWIRIHNMTAVNPPLAAVFRIRDVLIRIRGSVLLDYGSGSSSFPQWLSRCQQK